MAETRLTTDVRPSLATRATVDARGTIDGRGTVGRGTVDQRSTIGHSRFSVKDDDTQKLLLKNQQRSRGVVAMAQRESMHRRSSQRRLTSDRPRSEDYNPIEKAEPDEPWLTTSRTKLLLIWLPFQLAALGIFLYLTLQLLAAPQQSVAPYSSNLLSCGLLTVVLFAVASLKDFCIFLYFLLFGSKSKGFNDAVFVHMCTLPVDSAAILGASIWGSIILAKESTRECRQDDECNKFLIPMTLNVMVGYVYVNINLLVKPFLYCCYKLCFVHE